jgi:hypothetical protein
MSLVMSTAVMTGRTLIGIRRVYFKHVFVDVIEMHMMQVTVMQVIGVVGMSDSHMAAGGFVPMVVPLMLGAGTHRVLQQGMLPGEVYSRRRVPAVTAPICCMTITLCHLQSIISILPSRSRSR